MRPTNKKIWEVSYPIVLSLLAQNVIQITDTVLMGHVGEVEFGAVGMAGIYYISFFMLAFGFSAGCQILIGRRNGEQRYHEIAGIMMHGILSMLALAVVLYFLSGYVVHTFLPMAMKSQAVFSAAQEYLDWRTFGFFFSFVNVIFRAFFVGVTNTRVLTFSSIVMALVNLFFAYGLIFGKLGMPQMGVAGAGLSSVIAEASATVFFFLYTYLRVDLKKYGFHQLRFCWHEVRRIWQLSIFTMIQYSASMGTWFLFFLAIENHGERALAVTNVIRTFYMIFFIPMNALSTTANTLVSNTIGAGRQHEVFPLVMRIGLISTLTVVVMAGITALFPEFWISLVVSDADLSLIGDSVFPLYILLLALPICSLGTIFFNSVSGTGNTRTTLLFEVITLVAYMLALWVIVVQMQASVAVCWSVEFIYWGILMVLSFAYLRWGNWQKKVI